MLDKGNVNRNIQTLQEAAEFLNNELINEISNHTNFQNAEVSELADILVNIFNRLYKETNGYND